MHMSHLQVWEISWIILFLKLTSLNTIKSVLAIVFLDTSVKVITVQTVDFVHHVVLTPMKVPVKIRDCHLWEYSNANLNALVMTLQPMKIYLLRKKGFSTRFLC